MDELHVDAEVADNLEWGRLIPEVAEVEVVDNDDSLLEAYDVGEDDVDAMPRWEVDLEGLDKRRSSFRGDGESSMMRTQPEESPLFLSLSLSLSWLRLDSELLRDNGFSQLDLAIMDLLNVGEGIEEEEVGVSIGRGALLPMRRRGTRVCIFCSRVLTLARISVTICTPLLLEAVLVVELATDGLRVTGDGRFCGVLGVDE